MKKLKKGSLEAKRFMAKIRAMRKSSPKKSKKISGSSHKDTKSHNVNIRVLSGDKKSVYIDFYNKKKNFKKDRKYFKNDQEAKNWALKNLQKFDIDMIKDANIGKIKKAPVKKAKKVNVKEYLKKRGLRMPHGYETTKRVRITGTPPYKDPDAVREIQLYADNNSQLYFSRKLPILKNLQKKYKKGTFDVNKASKLWRYYIDDAMQRYHKEFGNRGKWYDMINTTDRQLLANEYAEDTLNEFELGNFVN